MEPVCCDSTFLIYYLKGKESAQERYSNLKNKFFFYTTSINVYEIFYGYFYAFKKNKDIEKYFEKIKQLFNVMDVKELTTSSAIRAGNLRVELQSQGVDIGNNDTLIAAITLENGGNILTDNLKHFKHVNGLNIL